MRRRTAAGAGSPLHRGLAIVAGLAWGTLASAADVTLSHPLARPHLDLNGAWDALVDPYDSGTFDHRLQRFDRTDPPSGGFGLDRRALAPGDLVEYGFDGMTLHVPGDWNSQLEKLDYYEGSIWYRRRFEAPATDKAERQFLYFGAANYLAEVFLNGRKLGHHVGGFTPFAFEVTGQLKAGENSLIIRVDNRRVAEGVPGVMTDWWNYGGLTREVRLIRTPLTYLAHHRVYLSGEGPHHVAFDLELVGATTGQRVELRVPELQWHATLPIHEDGTARGTFEIPGLERWSPESPRTYVVELRAGADRVVERIGFRTIETRGPDILLNGAPVFLRGVCLHEENPLRGGRAWSETDARLLLGWAKELGCNFVRLAHYPHNEHMARVADELGLLLWEEIPVYWSIAWDDPSVLANARRQLAELIRRDTNRASVIIWSVANETPVTETRTTFLRTLIDDARRLDGTRLVSAAMEMRGTYEQPNLKTVNDPLGAHIDIVSVNQYIGWYEGLPEKCDLIEWQVAYDKPVIVSEFGGGALAGRHGDVGLRFSEEFQAELYRRTLPMLERIPQFRGTAPWILVDFRSPRRLLPGIQDGWNRKGLLSPTGQRKQAWQVLHDYYLGRVSPPAADR